MGSTNGNGVLYDNFLMKRFVGNKRAMVSMANGRCGKRADNETGWDDLISRGYSVIETDFPAELTEYIEKTETAATDLEKYIDLYDRTDLSPYTSESEKAFGSALSTAKELLNTKASFSQLTAIKRYHFKLIIGGVKHGNRRKNPPSTCGLSRTSRNFFKDNFRAYRGFPCAQR